MHKTSNKKISLEPVKNYLKYREKPWFYEVSEKFSLRGFVGKNWKWSSSL